VNPGAAKMLVQELDARFPAYHVMNAFGILYPRYWCQSNAEDVRQTPSHSHGSLESQKDLEGG